eukprot:g6201.t1
MEGLPRNYRDNISVDNGVEIVWVNQKGQVIQKDKEGGPPASAADDPDVVVGMPRVASIRMSAVEKEVNGGAPASPGGARRISQAGTVSPSPQLIGAWFTSGGGGAPGSPTGSNGPPETEDDDADPEGHPCMALEPYARDMYNTVRKGLLGKKRTPMETLLSWKGKQIVVPLTIACNQNKAVSSECVSLFGDIMVYMGDKKGRDSGMQLLKSLQTRLLASAQELRDEILCQEKSLAPRTAPPCDVEIMALVQLSAVPVLVRLQDGNKVEVMADSWTSVTDLEKQIGSKICLKSTAPYTVFEVSNTDGQRALRAKERILDTVAQWRTQAAATSGVKKFQLLFKAVEDLCNGAYMVSTEDSIQLAAFQLQATRGDYDKKNCTVGSLEKELKTLVPPQEARALFMGLMYEVPSYGRTYFDGDTTEKPVVVGVGVDGVTAVMTLTGREGESTSFVKLTVVKIHSAKARQMKSLVHAYMVRYVLPKRKKQEAEEKAKKAEKDEVHPFGQDHHTHDASSRSRRARISAITSIALRSAVPSRAKRKDDGKNVALKRISVPAMDDKSRAKCMREVQLLQSLDHCNIIRYVDFFLEGGGEETNKLVIVFEWAAAGDLKRQVRKALEREVHFEERIIWGYFSQICGAISYMHQQRIMHRDLKPANIFLNLKGQVKVGDLGLGRLLSENNADEALAYSKVGTPLYMSPEVLRGGGYSWKSDIWSLGCILYELAMLRSPFKSEGLNLYTLFQKISSGTYPTMLDYYTGDLRALARDMLSTNPSNRPNADEAFSAALSVKERVDSMGQPPKPPETAVHLKPKMSPTKKKSAVEKDKDNEGNDKDGEQRAATTGTTKEGYRAAHACVGQGPKEPSYPIAAVAPTAGGAAAGTREGCCDPPPTCGAPPGPESGPVGDRSAPGSRGTFGVEEGVDNFSDSNQRHRRRHHHHHYHQHHHHHDCHHKSSDNSRACQRQEEGTDCFDQHQRQHQCQLHQQRELQDQQHQQKPRLGYDAPQATGLAANRGGSSGSSFSRTHSNTSRSSCSCGCKKGKVAANEMQEPRTGPGGGPAGKDDDRCATATVNAPPEAGAAKTAAHDQHRPEQRLAAGITASLFAVDQVAPPPPRSLPLTGGVMVAASGLSLPRVRAGVTAKTKASKAAKAKAKAAAPEVAAVAAVATLGPAVGQPNDLTPNRVNSGGDPRWSQFVEVGSGWEAEEVKAEAAATAAWTQPPPSSQEVEHAQQQHEQHEQHGQPVAGTRNDAREEDAPAAATVVVAEVVAKVSPLPAVVIGRRSRANNTTTTAATSTTTTTSSPSSSSPSSGRGRRGREEGRNPSSGGSGSGSGSGSRTTGEEGGGGEGGGGRGHGAGRDRNGDVKMMMMAETNSTSLKDGDDGDDNGNQDGEEKSSLRRTEERRERRRKRSDHNSKHRHQHQQHKDTNHSKTPSNAMLPSPLADSGDVRGEGVGPEQEGTEAAGPPTTMTTGGRGGNRPHRRRRGGSGLTASTITDTVAAAAVTTMADAAAAATAAAVAATAAATAAASAATAATAVAREAQKGSQAVEVASGPTNQRLPVSGDNLVAMEALLDRLSILGYQNVLQIENKPPLSRLHFAVPGDGDSGCDGSNAGSGRVTFPSRRKQFLGFVALSKWLLRQLGSGGGLDGVGSEPTITASASSSSDARTTVCVHILRGCEGLGFEPSRAAGAGAEATIVCPENLAVGSGQAVLEVLDWLSKSALKKMEGENPYRRRRKASTREEGTLEAAPGGGDARRRQGQERTGAEKQHTDCSDGRLTREGEAEADGVFVRHGGAAVAAPVGKRPGRWKDRSRDRMARVKANCQKTAEQPAAKTACADDTAGDNSNSKKASTGDSRHKGGGGDSKRVISAAFNRFGNNSSSNSSSRSANKRNRRGALPSEVVMMVATATASCLWGQDTSVDGFAFMRSTVEPTVHPDAWRSEQQRIAPRLVRAAAAGQGEHGKDSWAYRLGVLGAAAAAITRETAGDPRRPLPVAAAAAPPPTGYRHDAGSASGSGGMGQGRAYHLATQDSKKAAAPAKEKCCEALLAKVGGELSKQLESVAAGEQRVNSSGQGDDGDGEGEGGGEGMGGGGIARFREEARSLRAEEASLLREIADRQDRIAAKTDELCDAEDAAEEMDNKLADTVNEYSGATRLCQARSAIRQLKADIKAMDLLIGVKSATLAQKQLGRQDAARRAEVRAPVGSRWGGLHARAHGRGSRSRKRRTASSTTSPSSRSGSGSSRSPPPPSASTFPVIAAGAAAAAATNGVRDPSSGAGGARRGEGCAEKSVTGPPTEEEEAIGGDHGSTTAGGRGQGQGQGAGVWTRRSGVLIQEAKHSLTTRPFSAAHGGAGGGGGGGGRGGSGANDRLEEKEEEKEDEEGMRGRGPQQQQPQQQQQQQQRRRTSGGGGGGFPTSSSSECSRLSCLSWNGPGKARGREGGGEGWLSAAAW